VNRPRHFLLSLLAVLIGITFFAPAASAAPTELLRYYGDGSSATGAALGNAEKCDVNGDGFDDAVVGAWFWDKAPLANVGAAYVILGSENPQGGSLNNPAAAHAVRIDGPAVANAFVGFAVGCLGDVNGDGFDDVGISHYTAQKAYVVFGAEDFTPVDLGLLGSRGFEVRGNSSSGNVGFSLAPVGDLDGDGLDEFGVAEVVADTQGRTNNGRIWVISGQDDVSDVDLINPAPGQIRLAVDGANAEERLGVLSEVGDVNGDGKDDFLVGSYTATPWGAANAVPGAAAVIWGGTTGTVDLANLGNNGFRIFGPVRSRDRLGVSVSGAGDLNGDGKADLIIGADGVTNAATGNRNGSAWVVFGSASTATVYTSAPANDTIATAPGDVTAFTCANDPGTGTCASPADVQPRGYRIAGAVNADAAGYSVAGIGDVSGDGIPDFAIGAYGYDPVNPANPPATMSGAGAVYVVYGKSTTTNQNLVNLPAAEGYRIDGLAAGDRMGRQVGAFGDFDGNGVNDFFAGGDFASRPLAPGTPLSQAGEVIIGLNGALSTRTTLQVSPEGTSSLGQEFELTAVANRLAATPGPVGEGTFAFTQDGAPIAGCEAVAASAGGSTCSVTPGQRGTHAFAVEYSGVAGNLGASEASADPVRLTETTGTSLDPSVGELIVSHSVTFSASVNPGQGGATISSGTVAFTIDGQTVAGCGAVTVTGGEANCQTLIDSVGEHQVGAAFSGTDDLVASSASSITQVVIPVPASETTFSRGPDGIVPLGNPVTLTANVTGGDAVDQGTVDFLAGGEVIHGCGEIEVEAGTATCSPDFGRGRFSLSARFNGTDSILGSSSGAAQLDIRESTDASLTTSSDEVTVGRPVTFTAEVAPGQGGAVVSDGTVGFTIGGQTVTGCGASEVVDGEATCTTHIDTAGEHQIGASYSGAEDLFASTADAVTQTVVSAPASVTELSRGAANVVAYGAELTLRAGVTAAGEPADQGTVDFLRDGQPVGGCAAVQVADGEAVCETSIEQRGRASLTAEYSGSISILGSDSEVQLIDVRDGSSLTLSPDRTSVRVGQQVTVASSVTASHGGDVAEGYVELAAAGCEGCIREQVASGSAVHRLSFDSPGTYTVTGGFAGATWLDAATAAPLTITVTGAPQCAAVRPTASRAKFGKKGRTLSLRIASAKAADVKVTPSIRFRSRGRMQTIKVTGRQVRTGAVKVVTFRLSAAQARRLPAQATVVVGLRAKPVASDCTSVLGPQENRDLGRIKTGRGR